MLRPIIGDWPYWKGKRLGVEGEQLMYWLASYSLALRFITEDIPTAIRPHSDYIANLKRRPTEAQPKPDRRNDDH